MNMIDKLDISITRWDCGVVRSIEIAAGEPDACGHRFLVSASQEKWGAHFIVQTNFSDFYEGRRDAASAFAAALGLATMIDADGFGPSDELGEAA